MWRETSKVCLSNPICTETIQNTLVGLILQEKCTMKALWCTSYCFFIANKEEIVSAPYIQIDACIFCNVLCVNMLTLSYVSFYSGDQVPVNLTKPNFLTFEKSNLARHCFSDIKLSGVHFFPASIT